MMQREREPFFKPLNVNDGKLEMSINSQKSRLKQFSAEKAKQQEDDVSDEKMAYLHVKLHQEADKIRKWKNQTEFDLKQKDQKIQESTQTIESLRKSILDLQLQNENLSLALHDEISNRNEMVQSVTATRQLCSLLKDHMAKTDQKLIDCESEKTELRYLEREHKQQFEILSKKFTDLEENNQNQSSMLGTEISTLKEEHTTIRHQLEQRLNESETELELLQQKCDEKDIEIRDIRKEVQKNQEKIHTYEKTVDMLTDNVKSKEEEASVMKEQYKQLCDMHEALQVSKSSVEEKLKASECEIEALEGKYSALHIDHETSKESHASEMQGAQKKIEEVSHNLTEKEQKIQSLESDLEKTILVLEEVKSSKDMLIMEKAALEGKIKELEVQNAQLLSQQEQNCQTITEMSVSIEGLQTQLSVSQEEGQALTMQLNEFRALMSSLEQEKLLLGERMNTLEGDMTAKQSNLGDLQKELCDKSQQIEQLQQELQSLQQTLHDERESHEKTNLKLSDTEAKFHQSKEEVKSKAKELKTLQKELDTMTKENKNLSKTMEKTAEEEQKLREEIEELQSELSLQRENNESLLEERQKCDDALQGKLQSKDKETSDLETKNKTLKSDITAKNKQIKELEKEIKSQKSKITSITKTLDGKEGDLGKLGSKLEAEQVEKKELLAQIETILERMRDVETESEEAQKKATEMKAFSDQCLTEKQAATQQCESMRTEMSNIMQNYKSENDKLVDKKVQEIAALKTELQQATDNARKEVEEQLEDLKRENKKLATSVSRAENEMKKLQRTYGLKENEIIELGKENMKKDEELKGLQQQLERMALKSTATTVVQTSPFPDKTYQYSHTRAPTTPKDPPRTPKVNPIKPSSAITPICKQTPRLPRTPTNDLKTPQRSILKSLSSNSAMKKRRVVFATRDEEESLDGDSPTFEVIDQNDGQGPADCRTPLLLKPSPRILSAGRTREERMTDETPPVVPLTRMPRGPPVSQTKKKQAKEKPKEKPSSVRSAPKKEAGKFFKTSPKTKMGKLREKEDMSWFDRDDVFGFSLED